MLYDTIYKLPIRNYQRIIEENDLSYLSDEKFDNEKLLLIWDDINGQLIDEFGVSSEYQLLFYNKKSLLKWQIKQLLGDESAETEIELLNRKIERLEKKSSGVQDFKKHHARLHRLISKWSGRDSHNITTFEFFNDVKDFQEEQEQSESRQRAKENDIRSRKAG